MKIDFYEMVSSAYRLIKNSKTGRMRNLPLYKKVTEYVGVHYEGATCSDLLKTENGWSCIVNMAEKSIVLYISQNLSGKFEIWEREI